MTTLTSLITKQEALDTHNNLRLKEANFCENFPGNISTQFSIIVQTFHEIVCIEVIDELLWQTIYYYVQ